jgi:microsomal dipeptidase-like Zn-dependent dipeptidase
MNINNSKTVIDIHCDLLDYLQNAPYASPFNKGKIGCSLPSLVEGNVNLQVLAIYTTTKKGSAELAFKQSLIFRELLTKHKNYFAEISEFEDIQLISSSSKIGILAAIENASGICEEEESLSKGIDRLEEIIKITHRILYISLTHHQENRFGGGNNSKVGLKEDGKVVLDYINGKKIAIDLSHTSDLLAYDILDYLTKYNLDIPVLASHSNYRNIFDHPRNLPDDIAKEIIRRRGLIGINFLRAFLSDNDPNSIYDHIEYGLKLGAQDCICFGADYCYTDNNPDPSRKPFYFKEQESASEYPSILENISLRTAPEIVEAIGNKNALDYIRRIWS